MTLSLNQKLETLGFEYITLDDVENIYSSFDFCFAVEGEDQDVISPTYVISQDQPASTRVNLQATSEHTGVPVGGVVAMLVMLEYTHYSTILFKGDKPRYFLVSVKGDDADRIKNLPKLHPEYFCKPNVKSMRSTEEVLKTPYSVILNSDFQEIILNNN